MKKKIRLPSGKLGYLDSIDIDLEMKGKHFDALTTVQGKHFEEVVLSILKDLMEQDPYQLTQIDLMYVFTLVKIASFGGQMEITTTCPMQIHVNGGYRQCGAQTKFQLSLADDDVVYYEGEAPTVTLDCGAGAEVFPVKLPTMFMEIKIINGFEEKGIAREDLLNDGETALAYSKQRLAAHVFTERYSLEQIINALDTGTFKQKADFARQCTLLADYGIKHKVYEVKCKECGGRYNYRLPLYAGLFG